MNPRRIIGQLRRLREDERKRLVQAAAAKHTTVAERRQRARPYVESIAALDAVLAALGAKP